MPNTLAHLGIQGVLTRACLPDADLKWIYLGCVIPDLPWIGARIVHMVWPAVDPYDLRLYCIVQASLGFCLLVSMALALLASKLGRTFTILATGSLMHLLIDAMQTKWGNGVHFIVPFDWSIVNFGWFWPEAWPTYGLTLFGLIYVLYQSLRMANVQQTRLLTPSLQVIAALTLLTVYIAAPLIFFGAVQAADNHYVHTLRKHEERVGRYVEMDRARYYSSHTGPHTGYPTGHHAAEGYLQTPFGQSIKVAGKVPDRSMSVSIRGRFSTPDRVVISDYHTHYSHLRDIASYIGLLLVALVWAWELARPAVLRVKDK